MSSHLWEFFLRDDLESFQRFLASASHTSGGQWATGGSVFKAGSPGNALASSPGPSVRGKKLTGTSPGTSGIDRGNSSSSRSATPLSRAELNARDVHGRTLLHLVASSPKRTAVEFANALLEIPFLDIYAQDGESGWTALHRALYAGNATIAQALMTRDLHDATGFSKVGNTSHPSGSLIKIKDRDGYSPFDIYEATIMPRDIKLVTSDPMLADLQDNDSASSVPSNNGDDDDADDIFMAKGALKPCTNLDADEVYTFGSNKNLNLGLGDQDDRQFPERVTLERPEHLLQRFFYEYQEQRSDDDYQESGLSADLPTLIRNKPVKLQNVVMSKLHTAIFTDDPESNLFMSGFGPGGRLGTSDESTRFSFTCIETGGLAKKKVISVALGQDHSLAITEQGEIFSWGSNKFGQLGYNLPRANNRDDVSIQTTPRQIFNPFKKEVIYGAAASAIHSVVFSSSGLYTFGKNEGQLGLVDSDARSLEVQSTPRRVGASLFSAGIQMVTAIDYATAVLLQNHEVWVFSQYGYSKLVFPLDMSSRFIKDSFMATKYDTSVNHILKITSGGDTICALSSSGDVFTAQVNLAENPPALTSTTNPAKIRNSLSSPTRVWSVKRSHMAVRDVDVGQDGSIIICTNSGTAWRKEKRRKSKGALKDYKFVRIPGLSRVVGVRSNAFGAYAVAQRDCNVTREQIKAHPSSLWDDILPLSPFESLKVASTTWDSLDNTESTALQPSFSPTMAIKRAVMSQNSDIEAHFLPGLTNVPDGTVWLMSSQSEARIPVHEFMLPGRSSTLRKAFPKFRKSYYFAIPDVLSVEYGHDGRGQIRFHDVDFLTVLNLAFFLYTDGILDIWHQTRISPENASRYRQVRTEVMRLATHLDLPTLERAARLMIEPAKSLKTDMSRAIKDTSFFDNADVVVMLSDGERKVHSQIVCQRCPFFDALFHGHSGGKWLSSRLNDSTDSLVYVDLKHIEKAVFDFVFRYMYADTEEELFDDVRLGDLNEFIDVVFDVAFVANELMIDRLAQVCQKMLGRFGKLASRFRSGRWLIYIVNNRNVCHLLNIIAPCYVKEFKDAALEYICLNLEDLLANRLLEDLDGDLLNELDVVCHDNQMACFPISRGRNTEDYIFEKYPELVALMERDKQRQIDSMKLQSRMNRDDTHDTKQRQTSSEKPSTTPKAKGTSAKEMPNVVSSPVLKSKQSISDLMFQMDEEATLSPGDTSKGKAAMRSPKPVDVTESPILGSSLVEGDSFGDQSYLDGQIISSLPDNNSLAESPTEARAGRKKSVNMNLSTPPNTTSSSAAPWGSRSPMMPAKKDLKDIMEEASETRVSNLSLEMSKSSESPARKESISGSGGTSNANGTGNFTPKLSQKERKRLQQQQAQERLTTEQKAKEGPQNPWKLPSPSPAGPAPIPKPEHSSRGQDSQNNSHKATLPQRPAMTLRQTVAGSPKPGIPQSRKISGNLPPSAPGVTQPNTNLPPTPPSHHQQQQQPAPIHSVRHIPRPEPAASSSAGSLPLAAILMQQQTEKDEIREAATAKHNLQEIQQEQEFQEWWDKESKRVQGIPEEQDDDAGHDKNKTGGRNSGRGSSNSRRGNHHGNKRRGGGGGTAGNNGKDKTGSSSLTQQLSRPRPDLPPTGPSSPNPRRAGGDGRGGSRGRGKERARV